LGFVDLRLNAVVNCGSFWDLAFVSPIGVHLGNHIFSIDVLVGERWRSTDHGSFYGTAAWVEHHYPAFDKYFWLLARLRHVVFSQEISNGYDTQTAIVVCMFIVGHYLDTSHVLVYASTCTILQLPPWCFVPKRLSHGADVPPRKSSVRHPPGQPNLRHHNMTVWRPEKAPFRSTAVPSSFLSL
jgi:hypothetical protein